MEARAVARYVRISPRKVRQVVDIIRGKTANEALALLKHTPKGAAEVVAKVIKSAMANAEHNLDLNKDDLYVAVAYVDQGPTLKRWRARMRGIPVRIRKRTSHVTVILREKEG
ncbi:MAG TPA: 50S ribosomal protein L22 [Firmicutes bacterium]|nr:50S ribosomal protein L22 [Bacillota bacterium]